MNIIPNILFVSLFIILTVGSYGFLDPGITRFVDPAIFPFIRPLYSVVYGQRTVTAVWFLLTVIGLFLLWIRLLRKKTAFPTVQRFVGFVVPLGLLLVFSYPMLSYDLFNYMATAKVAYTYGENPYIVMPIEIPNDPNLSFTRAANKLALYGPTWIFLTAIPHWMGMGNVWGTILSFKVMNLLWYLAFLLILWKSTRRIGPLVWFGLNPLILLEILVSGHNDMAMMVLAVAGVLLWYRKGLVSRMAGLSVFLLSVFVKGSVLAILPLFAFRNFSRERALFIGSILLLMVFVVLGPLREELYPWYAVWFLACAAFLPQPKYGWLWEFGAVFSFALELRHIPYMAMGYYEGPGPALRIALTIIPVVLWIGWSVWKKGLAKKIAASLRS